MIHHTRSPERPVRLVVPYAAGGGTDLVARIVGLKLGEALGQNFIVENRTGASGMIGAQLVAKGPADGYSFLVASPAEIAGQTTPVRCRVLREVRHAAGRGQIAAPRPFDGLFDGAPSARSACNAWQFSAPLMP